VHDLFEENGTAYYVMDYVEGENLAERLKRTGKPMSEQEVLTILPQILDALKSVHNEGMWHLDLKPANIMVDKVGNVKLIDFGASKQLNAQKGGATTSTAISYTNGYAPREQMEQNYDKFGPWTDIYALGATLYNLLTNKRPPLPSDIDDDDTSDKHQSLPFSDGVSDDMKKLILLLMHTNRKLRPQSIREIFSVLDKQPVNPVDIKHNDSEDSEVTIIASRPSESVGITSSVEKDGSRNSNITRPNGDTNVEGPSAMKVFTITILSIVLFFALVIGLANGCNNKVQQAPVDTDSIAEVVDSIAVDTVAADTVYWY
jgi:serine/threonine protein kinase